MFRIVFWDVLQCKIIVDRRFRGAVDNYFTRQYIPEDNSEHHTCRCENLKSYTKFMSVFLVYFCLVPFHHSMVPSSGGWRRRPPDT
jgi:hypothetical protein